MKAEISQAIESILPEALTHLKALVGMNSFTSHIPGIEKNSRYITQLFQSSGFKGEWVASENLEFGNHLFLSRGDKSLPTVCLVSHLDTVYPEEEEIREKFVWREDRKRGIIFGPGTVDIKGGTMVIWLVIRCLEKHFPALFEKHRWLIAVDASEEVMSRDFGIRTQERCPKGAKAVLVFEGGPQNATTQYLVTGRKGRFEVKIKALGKAAHAGSAIDQGRNAIVALGELLPQMARISSQFEELTVNVATVKGGTVLNRVPHEAEAELEMRAFQDAVLEAALQEIRKLAEEVSKETGVNLRVELMGKSPAWPQDEKNLGIYECWAKIGESLGHKVQPMKRGGLSDANYVHHLGPTLDGLGASGGNAHSSQLRPEEGIEPEYIETASLLRRSLWNILALAEWLK